MTVPHHLPDTAASLPILDFRALTAPDRGPALAALARAARDPGFFYLTGHGIAPALITAVEDQARQFFALPQADKDAIAMVNSPQFRGYNRPAQEFTRGRPDWREQIDIGSERPALPADPAAPPWTRLQGPNQWPVGLPDFRPVILEYLAATTALAIRVLGLFAAALGQPEDAFRPIHTPAPTQLLKLIRYPGRDGGDDGGDDGADRAQGVGAHKDSGFVTLLHQDGTGGLQVETDRGWVDAPALPGTLLVNIGEILELASAGYLRATCHRVAAPRGRDRLSVAFFLGAALDATVPVLPLAPDLAAAARGISRDPLNPLFHEVGRNALKSRLRSHPDVARRHHADLTPDGERRSPVISPTTGPGARP